MSSIESGKCYKIINEESGLVFDLAGGDSTTVLGWESHGGDNQRWILDKKSDGQWTIRSVRLNKYLGFEDSPKDGTTLFGFQTPPFLWDIEILPDSEDHDDTRVRFWVRGTLLVVELPIENMGIEARELQLCAARDGRYQIWILKELPNS
ncbi:Ricin B lectin domain containing protein [Lactarius tabidus]